MYKLRFGLAVALLFLMQQVNAYEYVYCEDLETGEWQWLPATDGSYHWVHGHDMLYRKVEPGEVYTFGSMPVKKKVFLRLHEMCETSFGKDWVPHPGGLISDWNLFHYIDEQDHQVFSRGRFTPKKHKVKYKIKHKKHQNNDVHDPYFHNS